MHHVHLNMEHVRDMWHVYEPHIDQYRVLLGWYKAYKSGTCGANQVHVDQMHHVHLRCYI